MQSILNKTINTLKWPIAIISLLMLPGSFLAVLGLIGSLLSFANEMGLFLLGFVGYGFCWWALFRRRVWGSAFSTLEHELTHALFAMLTFHRIKSIKTTWNSGGSIQYEGGGNWLITIAPYFFPTLSVLALTVQCLVDSQGSGVSSAVLGATLSYHLTSTSRELHREQTDLQETGFFFAALFLPTANLLGNGFILAFAVGGWSRGRDFILEAWVEGADLGLNLLGLS